MRFVYQKKRTHYAILMINTINTESPCLSRWILFHFCKYLFKTKMHFFSCTRVVGRAWHWKPWNLKRGESILFPFHSTLLVFPFFISHLHILKLYLLNLFYTCITLSSLLNTTLGIPLAFGANTDLSFVLLFLPFSLDVIVMCDPSGSRAR